MSRQSEEFPLSHIDPADHFPQLREIPQSPKEFTMRGNLVRSKDTLYLGIVGSRNYTSYGKSVCQSLINGLAGYPITIVSGLAIGIDSIAHKSALEAGLPTIALPGSGLDWSVLYPAQHKELARDILQSGGALLSEFDTMLRGVSWAFPQRNRLIAGICSMIIIIEAEEKSGTLITARLATEYNKIVGAVPGPITSSTSVGAHQLLKLGATPITTSEDILEELHLQKRVSPADQNTIILNTQEEKIIDALIFGPKIKEHIIEELGLNPGEASITFSTLEIKGAIKETLGLIERII